MARSDGGWACVRLAAVCHGKSPGCIAVFGDQLILKKACAQGFSLCRSWGAPAPECCRRCSAFQLPRSGGLGNSWRLRPAVSDAKQCHRQAIDNSETKGSPVTRTTTSGSCLGPSKAKPLSFAGFSGAQAFALWILPGKTYVSTME